MPPTVYVEEVWSEKECRVSAAYVINSVKQDKFTENVFTYCVDLLGE